jgi:hypothetical protein
VVVVVVEVVVEVVVVVMVTVVVVVAVRCCALCRFKVKSFRVVHIRIKTECNHGLNKEHACTRAAVERQHG